MVILSPSKLLLSLYTRSFKKEVNHNFNHIANVIVEGQHLFLKGLWVYVSQVYSPVVPPPGWESAEMMPGYLRQRKSSPYLWW